MKKLALLFVLVQSLVFAQGEQRYADGTATDQDGNTFEWINYGTQDWAIENAEVVTYRDGTPIPQITDGAEWESLTTGAWCYYYNEPDEGILYNAYAVIGKHDNDETTPNKDLAPFGWRISTNSDWYSFEDYLYENGYNYDESSIYKLAQATASPIGWKEHHNPGSPGFDQTLLNNASGFNAQPDGFRVKSGGFLYKRYNAIFWTSTVESGPDYTGAIGIGWAWENSVFNRGNDPFYLTTGLSVRFVRDASTASTKDYTDAITIYPNPTTSIVTLQGDNEYDIEVYTLQGKKVMTLTGNTIDMSHLSSAIYIVKAANKEYNEELTYKVVNN